MESSRIIFINTKRNCFWLALKKYNQKKLRNIYFNGIKNKWFRIYINIKPKIISAFEHMFERLLCKINKLFVFKLNSTIACNNNFWWSVH